jgi:hypothetical protein
VLKGPLLNRPPAQVLDGRQENPGAPANGAGATSQRPRKGGGGGGGGDADDKEKERMRGALGGAIVTEKPNVKWDDGGWVVGGGGQWDTPRCKARS